MLVKYKVDHSLIITYIKILLNWKLYSRLDRIYYNYKFSLNIDKKVLIISLMSIYRVFKL